MRDHVLIYVNGTRLKIAGDAVFLSLVEFLRQRGSVGTKIGCAEGDCGACTVLCGVPENGALSYRAIVSCIQPVHQLDGSHIVTVEGVAEQGELSPVQQAMVEHHGSQCGFCTPGFVNSLTGFFECAESVNEGALRTHLAGNLCRCTGYEPIVAAGLAVDPARICRLSGRYPSPAMVEELDACSQVPILIETGPRVFFRPIRLEEAIEFRRRHPGAVITAGGTELGVARNRHGLEPPWILSLMAVSELTKITLDGDVLSVGANVTWSRLETFTQGRLPEIHGLVERFGSPQIRNVATLVGNIAHGSPVADSVCFLAITLAELELISSRGTRRVAIKDFHTGPKRTVVAPDEIITRVLIPITAPGEIVKLYKISKRKEMDVSTFRAGIRIKRRGELVESAAIAYCGVGPKVVRLPRTEAFLSGRPFSEATFRQAGALARAEVEPITDVRGSREYRLALAENVLVKFYHDTALVTARTNGKAGSVPAALGVKTAGPPAGGSMPHESAQAHVTGRAVYVDDLPPFRNELLVEFFGSPLAHGRIVGLDSTVARKVEGIAAVFAASDVPGDNHFGPIAHDEELLALDECHHIGQPIVVLAGESRAALRAARSAIRLQMEELPAVLSIDAAIAGEHFIGPTRRLARGDAPAAMALAQHVIEGTFRTGGQEHFYLETQAALAIPGEDGQMTVHSSTQNPSEIQAVVAHCLGLGQNMVVCTCTRMGGGFGGKESQAAHPALLAALVAHKTGRPARIVYPRDLDMRVTGKRHPFLSRYRAGFNDDGRIEALTIDLYADGGYAADLSLAVMERALLHTDNAYFIPHLAVTGTVCRTNLPSNTAMRGFGGPQGIAAVENVIEEIAAHLGIDALEVRRRNCYGGPQRDTTHYGQVVANNTLPMLIDRLAQTSDYACRRDEIARSNATSPTHLRGIALVPVKFGISFTRRALNQANALLNIYLDGTIQVSTGGTEMGQGLNTKIRQIVAGELAVSIDAVRVMPTSTEKNNNTSPTAASASTDLNGTAALRAAVIVKARLADAAARHFASAADGLEASAAHIRFEDGVVHDIRRPGRQIAFGELVKLAYEERVDLGVRSFYATPGVDFNRETGRGNPFLYFTNGAAVSEVVIDRLTGELVVKRVDILMDLGKSLNPDIDRGQVIGGFVQGMGWVTTEELLYSETGELLSHSPNNYKIPGVESMPPVLRVDFLDNPDNPINLLGSKAVGEPPFVLGISVGAAAKSALSSLAPGRSVPLSFPATSEELLKQLSALAIGNDSEPVKTGQYEGT
jgi:xanthine dehydrogenase molybdopterin binding subunit/xanthine dehydrogenase small subunit